MSMSVETLRELLADLPAEAVVRLATQPNYPLAFEVHGVATSATIAAADVADTPCPDHGVAYCEDCLAAEAGAPVVWITEGGSVYDAPYAPRGAWDAAERW